VFTRMPDFYTRPDAPRVDYSAEDIRPHSAVNYRVGEAVSGKR
jgi:hypothetical protein